MALKCKYNYYCTKINGMVDNGTSAISTKVWWKKFFMQVYVGMDSVLAGNK